MDSTDTIAALKAENERLREDIVRLEAELAAVRGTLAVAAAVDPFRVHYRIKPVEES